MTNSVPSLVIISTRNIVYYQNVRGLRSKTKNLFLASSSSDYCIIALSETWLNSDISNSELFDQNFDVHRCDRSPLTSSKSVGGGVLIAVKSCFSSELLKIPDTEFLEIVFVKLRIHKTYNWLFIYSS